MFDFMALLPGWEIAEQKGSGNYGVVYRITRDLFDINEEAALKVMNIPKKDDTVAEMRLEGYSEQSILEDIKGKVNNVLREYKTSKALSGNTNIVDVDDLVIKASPDGLSYEICMKMELLKPLMLTIDGEAFFTEEQTIKLAKDMCKALIACQKLNIIHRDIKPENIMLSKFGDYKLGDFGIAKAVERTMGGTKAGTNKFIAPEVYKNQPYGHRADIYSLGIVLYWMLNKKRIPFLSPYPETIKAGEVDEAIARRIEGEQILSPSDGSDALKKIVLKACAFKPEDRYENACEMLEDLQKLDPKMVAVVEFSSKTKVLNNEFKDNQNIRYVVIPEGIVEIGNGAFSNCSNLESVSFPKTLKKIGVSSFENCCNLLNVSIPQSVESIGNRAFAGCKKLQVLIPKNNCKIGKTVFSSCESTTEFVEHSIFQKEKSELEKQVKLTQQENKNVNAKLNDTQKAKTAVENELAKHKKEKEDIALKLKDAQVENTNVNNKLKISQKAKTKAELEVASLKKEKSELEAKVAKLNKEYEALNNRFISSINEAKRQAVLEVQKNKDEKRVLVKVLNKDCDRKELYFKIGNVYKGNSFSEHLSSEIAIKFIYDDKTKKLGIQNLSDFDWTVSKINNVSQYCSPNQIVSVEEGDMIRIIKRVVQLNVEKIIL